MSRGQYQYTLAGTDTKEVGTWAERLAQCAEELAVAARRRVGGAGQRLPDERADRSRDRRPARRVGADRRRYAQRRLRATPDLDQSTDSRTSTRVILEAKPEFQNDPASLTKIYVPASGIQAVAQSQSLTSSAPTIIPTVSGSSMVPLSAIARFEHGTAPLVIAHQEQFPAVTISFNLAPDASLSDAVRVISQAEREIGMPSAVIGSYSGDAAEFAKSLAGEPWLILAAAVAIYIVLGVLYESFIHPHHHPVHSAVGRRRRAARADVVQAGPLGRRAHRHRAADGHREEERDHDDRLRARGRAQAGAFAARRPSSRRRCCGSVRIMMTTLAALFGAIPLAVESGTGSELRNPLGITIVGGLLLRPAAHALHDAGDLPGDGAAEDALEPATAAADRARPAGGA